MSTNQKKMSNGLMHCNVIVAAFCQSFYPIQVISPNLNDISCSCKNREETLHQGLQCLLFSVYIVSTLKSTPKICILYHFKSCIYFRSSDQLSRSGAVRFDVNHLSVSFPLLVYKPKKINILNPNKHQFIQFIRQSRCGHISSKLTE